MAPEFKKVIRQLKKPLEYACGLDPERIKIIRGLGGSLTAILDNHPETKNAFQHFRSSLKGLDSLDGKEKMAKVIGLIRILDRMEKSPPARVPEKPEPPPKKLSPRELRIIKELAALETEVQYVKGVGPRLAERLSRLGIETVDDLLYHLPARYEDRRDMKKIREVAPGERATVLAEIVACGAALGRNRRSRGYNLLLHDGTGLITAKWFHYQGDYLERKFKQGQWVIASSMVKEFGKTLEMHHPDVEIVEDVVSNESGEMSIHDSNLKTIVPVYPLTEGLFQKTVLRITDNALDSYSGRIPEVLPRSIIEKRSLPGLEESLRAAHSPPEDADIAQFNDHTSVGHHRLAYDEFFFLELGLALRRRGMIEEPAVSIKPSGELVEKFRRSLPFALTSSQDKVISEILGDLARRNPMHRLLQGDVGSGKTVVALAAALAAIEAGYQVGIMAPTEILAEQHYRTVKNLLGGIGVEGVLLTGAVRGKARQSALDAIAAGDVPLVLGTHAVIQEKVKFNNFALGIVDEQHRFGVLQRAKFKAKGTGDTSPHLLVMTATPIPRTLAMTVYGDLAVSVIRQMPPGRTPIKTKLFRERDREKVYALVRKEVGRGRQVFVVYPLVEESEKLELKDASSMSKYFKEEAFSDLRVGLIHGKMKSVQKDAVMKEFLGGEIDVLVATTVIEVGIDVPNASMMVVEHAERFGLSQLHQLRGRVGRGDHQSQCLLLAQFTRSEDAWKRLQIMVKTLDGFKIAEEDLAIRGPGEFFGTRQSGLPDFRVANIIRDAEVLSQAREDAFELVKNDPRLEGPGHGLLRTLLRKRWGKRLRLGRVG